MFWGKSVQEINTIKLGTFAPHFSRHKLQHADHNYDRRQQNFRPVPDQFDSRSNWPGKIRTMPDQKNCAADWAIVAASTDSSIY